MEELRIKVLGGIQVQLGGKTIEFSRHKATALLVYLTVTGERQSRGVIALRSGRATHGFILLKTVYTGRMNMTEDWQAGWRCVGKEGK
jgi:hypothetical protein